MRKILLMLSTVLYLFNTGNAQDRKIHKDKTGHAAKAALIISFYSIGAGTNGEAYSAVMALIKTHNAKNHTRIKYEEIHWGREGERDLCFPMQSTRNFRLFVKLVKIKCAKYQHVNVTKNTPCRSKG